MQKTNKMKVKTRKNTTEERIKCISILNSLKKKTGIDIRIKTRKREYTDLRKVFCKLCFDHTIAPLDLIGGCIRNEFTHDIVIYNLKEFDSLMYSYDFKYKDVYLTTNKEIILEEKTNKEIEKGYFYDFITDTKYKIHRKYKKDGKPMFTVELIH